VRMGATSTNAKIFYELVQTMTENTGFPCLDMIDNWELSWELKAIGVNTFEPQDIELQIWDTQAPQPINIIPIHQTSPKFSYIYQPDFRPGIYYCRLKIGSRVETLAKIRFYSHRWN